jgi:diguanylate cyclase (GGDEF)-like protein
MVLLFTLSGLALAASVAFVVAAGRLSSLRAAARSLEAHAAATDRDLAAARRQADQAEADRLFLARFVRELPHVAHELHSRAGGRQIPRLILGATIRVLEPRKAVVAVRRRPAESDPDRHTRLTIAAVFPAGGLEIGDEIPIGRGEIGYAAEVQRVMDRRDFEAAPAPTRRRLREETAPSIKPDLVAPMIFNEEVVGVIAVEGLRHGTTEAKDVLRLLAQVGAVSVHTQAKYTEMRATASIDGLTGIFNKRFLTHRLAEEVRRALDEVSSASVFLFDLDNFKHYNDRNGHVAGDRLLLQLSRLVQENVRKDTTVGRYGGEEFLVIFPGTKRAQALAAAENIRQAIAAHEFPFGFDQPLGFVSISGGVAECPIDGSDAATLVRAADEALYQAKRGGRNRVLAYQPTYLGGDEAQAPVPAEEQESAKERAALVEGPSVGETGDAVALAVIEETARRAGIAADFTPAPGTLLSVATLTPAAGIPRLTLAPTAAVLTAALAEQTIEPEPRDRR